MLTESLTGSHLCKLVPEILDADFRDLILDLASFGTLDLLFSSYWKLEPEIAVRTLGDSAAVLKDLATGCGYISSIPCEDTSTHP